MTCETTRIVQFTRIVSRRTGADIMHGRINTLYREGLQTEGLSPVEAAVVAGVGRTNIFKLISDGSLPARKIGKKTIILRGDLMAFLDGLPRAGTASAT
jgi:excisionase family DNA binding protein